ncbi:uncharacterized protein LY89DRAFT_689418 [Mollisia scopiformis]|uniref:MYND-type domain-containing protein n=1 Tax=Mollisia scopiformis TaxID=149040 RepID=A0A194WT17_MOLSC|nr:uncharacterized protein LY89DRAFT_689418 [Mollisia scopiformis]KUJ10814.1 hypothetical protein LY89DRAFT_689418 [Mollisia scopiformis]
MAPSNFPGPVTLYTIGYAALKYPSLPPAPVNVPLGDQVGLLQHQLPHAQNHQIAQLASQYLNALLTYQTSSDPALHDPSTPQYYFSTAICLLNFLNTSPDVCKRIASHPTLLHDVVEKLLANDVVEKMKAVPRPGGANFPAATFDDDFGSLLQFLSTVLLYIDDPSSVHERFQDLIPKLRAWKREFRGSRVRTISNAADRLVGQIQGTDATMLKLIRGMQDSSLVCGVQSCGVRGAAGLTVCGTCKIQRYCGREHQKADWKFHKHICDKGLVEPED